MTDHPTALAAARERLATILALGVTSLARLNRKRIRLEKRVAALS